jgi:hypothetical protein
MPRQGFTRRGNGAARTVASKIRSLHLNASPKWFKSRSRNADPSCYNASVPITRKIRFVGKTLTTGSLTLEAVEIAGALLGSSTFVVSRIKAYANAGPNMLQLSTNINLAESNQVFDDLGTTGAHRPCVDVEFPQTGLTPISVSSTAKHIIVDVFDTALARVVSDVVIDLWLTVDWFAPVKVIA